MVPSYCRFVVVSIVTSRSAMRMDLLFGFFIDGFLRCWHQYLFALRW
jgi:hypothetical protein